MFSAECLIYLAYRFSGPRDEAWLLGIRDAMSSVGILTGVVVVSALWRLPGVVLTLVLLRRGEGVVGW